MYYNKLYLIILDLINYIIYNDHKVTLISNETYTIYNCGNYYFVYCQNENIKKTFSDINTAYNYINYKQNKCGRLSLLENLRGTISLVQ